MTGSHMIRSQLVTGAWATCDLDMPVGIVEQH